MKLKLGLCQMHVTDDKQENLRHARELLEDFHQAVDDYLALCAAEGVEPEKAYKGSFNVRISPELHKQAIIAATAGQMSLNSFVERSIKQAIEARS